MNPEKTVVVITLANGFHHLLTPGQRVEVDAEGRFFLKWSRHNYETGEQEKFTQGAGHAIVAVQSVSVDMLWYRFKLDPPLTSERRATNGNAKRGDIMRMREAISNLKKDMKT